CATLLVLLFVVPNRKNDPDTKDIKDAATTKKKDDTDGGKKPPKKIINSIGMKLVRVEPGAFFMGAPKSEPSRRNGETLHEVEITKPFYLGKFEVTQEQYEAIMGENPSAYSPTGGKKDRVAGKETGLIPVDSVSWEDAKEFCNRLSKKEGKEYRLPT